MSVTGVGKKAMLHCRVIMRTPRIRCPKHAFVGGILHRRHATAGSNASEFLCQCSARENSSSSSSALSRAASAIPRFHVTARARSNSFNGRAQARSSALSSATLATRATTVTHSVLTANNTQYRYAASSGSAGIIGLLITLRCGCNCAHSSVVNTL